MDSGTAVDMLLVIGFILMGGVFAATELALVSLRSGQVDRLEEEGGRGKAVAGLARDPNRFLSAVQIGVTVAGFFSAAFGASTLAPSFAPTFEELGVPAPETVSLVVTTLVVSYLSLVLGELVPKRIALQRSVAVARIFAPPLGGFATVMKPVIWLLSISTNALVRLLGGDPKAAGDEVDETELRMMIAGHEDIPADERKIVDDVFEAGDRMVVEVMTPRTDVAFLDDDLTLAEAVEAITQLPFTRYPVTGRDFDEILGYVHLRDLLGRAQDQEATVRDIVRDLVVLPGTSRVLSALNALRHNGAHLALVIDEYGGTDGIVTLEDLVEELVGEIQDEYDQDAADLPDPANPDGVDAGLNIQEFAERTGVELEDGPYETVAGYVLDRLGRIAHGGERVTVGGHVLEVCGVDGHRITRVRVLRAEGVTDDEAGIEGATATSTGPDTGDERP
jgi:putative hemolysin